MRKVRRYASFSVGKIQLYTLKRYDDVLYHKKKYCSPHGRNFYGLVIVQHSVRKIELYTLVTKTIIFISEMLTEVLRGQAEEKVARNNQIVQVSSAHSVQSDVLAIKTRFPISEIKDFIKFNDDLREKEYYNLVVNIMILYYKYSFYF